MNGIEIFSIRTRLDIGRSRMAQMLGISVTTLLMWENDRRKPPAIFVAFFSQLTRQAMRYGGDETSRRLQNAWINGGMLEALRWTFTEPPIQKPDA